MRAHELIRQEVPVADRAWSVDIDVAPDMNVKRCHSKKGAPGPDSTSGYTSGSNNELLWKKAI